MPRKMRGVLLLVQQYVEDAVRKKWKSRFVGLGGVVLEASEGTAFSYLATDEPYVRFEAEGSDGRVFLQPMYGESFGG